jgi:hypothetical protein
MFKGTSMLKNSTVNFASALTLCVSRHWAYLPSEGCYVWEGRFKKDECEIGRSKVLSKKEIQINALSFSWCQALCSRCWVRWNHYKH